MGLDSDNQDCVIISRRVQYQARLIVFTRRRDMPDGSQMIVTVHTVHEYSHLASNP